MTDNQLKSFELYFYVAVLKSDTREYRQDSDQLLPEGMLKVCVLLPRENEYVYNLSEISLKEVSGETAPDPVLTPKGLAYVKKQLESGYDVSKLAVPESEDWDAAVETEKKLEPAKAEPKSDWGDPDFDKDDKNKVDEEPWEGDWE